MTELPTPETSFAKIENLSEHELLIHEIQRTLGSCFEILGQSGSIDIESSVENFKRAELALSRANRPIEKQDFKTRQLELFISQILCTVRFMMSDYCSRTKSLLAANGFVIDDSSNEIIGRIIKKKGENFYLPNESKDNDMGIKVSCLSGL